MKVLVVAPQPFFVERGTPIAVRLLAEALCDSGHDVDLLVYHEGRDVEVPRLRIIRSWKLPGLEDIPIGFSWKKIVADAALCFRLVQLVAKNNYDVIHAVEEAVFPAALVNSVLRRRLVYDMDSSLSDQMIEKWGALQSLRRVMEGFENWALRRADLVLPVCERLAEKARRALPAERVQVLEDIAFEPADTDDGVENLRQAYDIEGPLILYVGNLEHYQGIGLLLESLGQVRQSLPFRLVVIGGTRDAISQYSGMATAFGIAGKVHFAGPKPFGNLPYYLEQADILVSPRIKGENTPMKIYSYLASGKPVLATNIRSHTQVLQPPNALLADPDPSSMAAGLTQLLENADLREEIGRAGQVLATARYSLQSYRIKLREGYARLPGPGGRAVPAAGAVV